MKIEAGGGGKKERPSKMLSRFWGDPNGPRPPEKTGLDLEPIKRATQGATLAGIVAFSGGHFASDETTHGPKQEQALSPELDQAYLSKMIEDISSAPVDSFERSAFSAEEIKCLTDNLYHEGRSESKKGRAAIAAATIERVGMRGYPDNICGVVYQARQFSWTHDKKVLSRPINMKDYLKISIEVAELAREETRDSAAVVARMQSGLPRGAIFYKLATFTGSPNVEKFFSTLQYVGAVDAHDFYIKKDQSRQTSMTKPEAGKVKTVPLPVASPRRQLRQAGRIHES